jgi:DNA-binding transcriptional LysR family regulator
MMDKLRSMAVFVGVVESGSFSAAADALNISAVMVGKHMRSWRRCWACGYWSALRATTA